MITLDIRVYNKEELKRIVEIAQNNELNVTPKASSVLGIVPSQVLSVIGDSAQIIALLVTLYQTFGNKKRINFYSDKQEQYNIDLDEARKLAEDESLYNEN